MPDEDNCIACDLAFQSDDMVLNELSGGFIHAACCGPEPESYYKNDGDPLEPGDTIPEPFRYGDLPTASPQPLQTDEVEKT